MSKKPVSKPEEPKPWGITQADMESITDKEFIYGTNRCLPPFSEIPKEYFVNGEFKPSANMYTRIADAMYCGEPVPKGEVNFLPGFEMAGQAMARFLMAHLKSIEADYDHKMAGVAYMMTKIVKITAILT